MSKLPVIEHDGRRLELQPSMLRVMSGIEQGLGAWHGAERPKQRGYRSGTLKALLSVNLIAWMGHPSGGGFYGLTDSGRSVLAAHPVT